MKLSTRARYGMRAMIELAQTEAKSLPVEINTLARNQELSVKYLEKLMAQLKKAELVVSVRGAHGGYLLSRASSLITVLDIVEALDGPVDLVYCTDNSDYCGRQCDCSSSHLWKVLAEQFRSVMRSITLDQVAEDKVEEIVR